MPKTAEGNTLQLLREKNPEQFEEFKGLRVPKGSKKKGSYLWSYMHPHSYISLAQPRVLSSYFWNSPTPSHYEY